VYYQASAHIKHNTNTASDSTIALPDNFT